MHAAQPRPRRHERLDEDELFGVARGAERRAESYHSSHHHSGRAEPYSSSSANQRSYPSPSHSRRSDDWRVAEPALTSTAHNRYRDNVGIHSRRDEYYARPEGWNNRHAGHSQYSSSRREWPKRNGHGYNSTSYSENRSWGRPTRHNESSRGNNSNEGWYREGPRNERESDRYIQDEGYPARERDIRPRENDVVPVETTQTQKSPYWSEQSHDRPQWRREDRESGRDTDRDIVEDSDRTDFDANRKWEPAPSWKSKERDDHAPAQYERSEATLPLSRPGKKQGKGKKKGFQAFQKRDQRKEDNMNNWQKREFIPAQRFREVNKSSTAKRRHDYTTESHPYSPAHSVYSHRSSNRSRSRSASPKRRKGADEPQHTTTAFVAKKDNNRRGRSPTWSATSTKPQGTGGNNDQTRQSSMSSRSSHTRSRSRSSSDPPEVKPKQKHRLPLATSIRDIEIQAKSLRLSSNTSVRQGATSQNAPSARVHELESQPPTSFLVESRESQRVQNYHNEYEAMPPPVAPASASLSGSINGTKSTVQPLVAEAAKSVKRNAGFKPIGTVRPSPAMKRFFPGEDEESDINVMQENRQNQLEDGHQTDHREDSDSRQRLGSTTSPSVRSDRDLDTYNPRDRRGQHTPRTGESLDRDITTPGRRPERAREHTPSSRQGMSNASMQLDSAPPTPKQDRPPSVDEDFYMNGRGAHEASRPPSRPSEFQSRIPAVPSPVDQQDGDDLGAERMQGPPDEIYAIVSQVGEGTFGKVYKARNNITGVHVALKRIRMETERDGFPVTAMREIKLLQSLRHVNVVQLMEMMVHRGSVYMIFEYMDHDLTGVLSQTQFSFTDAHLKSLCQQMLQGLSYLHRKGVIHRDIKGSNILINNRGELKLADFGLARFYQKRRRADYTNRVITLWYRPPELLLGTTVYGPEVDMWSAGCIMLELFCKKPVFQGNDEIHQLDVIYKILGTPTAEEWPNVTDMPWYELVKPRETLRNRFRELFKRWLSPAALGLAERLLSYDPDRRATADQALEAPYFTQEDPPPALPAGLASLEGEWHEFESKRERAKKRRKLESASGGTDPSSLPPQ